MSTSATPTATTTTWNIEPNHTLVEFSAKHMMITTVKGRFRDVSGTIVIDEANPARSHAEVSIAAATIDTGVAQRDQHLVSGDFLDADNHKAITFRTKRIDGARAQAGQEFTVVGDLTIRGTTREVTLKTSYEGRGKDPWGGERISFAATGKIDRRDFGLTWNQALEAGGILVSNDIKISIEVQAVRA
ncbi:MAG TPA: YceI family protein [Gemmatimonadaceae bacterium]|nr:YceI family protein [Gemmatimonadaceae bacterium]